MSRSTRCFVVLALVALVVLTPGCVGPFNLTSSVLEWNREVSSNEWVQEGIFLLLVIVPVYGITVLGDALIFNSIEFWSGDNVIN